MGDWRFFITSQPTFGLGTGPQSAKLLGTGIEYDHLEDNLWNLDTVPPLAEAI